MDPNQFYYQGYFNYLQNQHSPTSNNSSNTKYFRYPPYFPPMIRNCWISPPMGTGGHMYQEKELRSCKE